MRQFELIREIPNCCKNNQMRDVFFDEVSCDDPEDYVRSLFAPGSAEVTMQQLSDHSFVVYAQVGSVLQKFHFTPILG